MRNVYELLDAPPAFVAIVVAMVSLGLFAFGVAAFVRARARAKLAAEEAASLADPAKALHEGEVVLSGKVEHAAGEEVAVRVEVMQHGSEREISGSWSHRWEEVDRKVIVRPFYLVLPDDKRVRVEPSGDVDVADDLDGKVLISRTSRKLTAELIPGETVHIRGWLERGGDAMPDTAAGYRDVTWGWLLRPARGRMLLSSHPLGDGLRVRSGFHRRWGVIAMLAFAIVQLTLIGFYRRALGVVDAATIVDLKHSTYEDSDGDTQDTYEVTVVIPDGAGGTTEISETNFHELRQGDQIPLRRAGSSWNLGSKPTISWPHVLGIALATSALALWYRQRRRASRPWFRRKMVETGSGQL